MVEQRRQDKFLWTWPVCLSLAVMVIGSQTQLRGQNVKVIVSSQAGDRLSPKPHLRFGGKAEATGPTFSINDGVTYQKIDGFGASILEGASFASTAFRRTSKRLCFARCLMPGKGRVSRQ